MSGRRNIHRESLRLAFSRVIKRVSYPITRRELVEYIREEAGGDDLVHIANHLPNKLYKNQLQIIEEVKEIVPAL